MLTDEPSLHSSPAPRRSVLRTIARLSCGRHAGRTIALLVMAVSIGEGCSRESTSPDTSADSTDLGIYRETAPSLRPDLDIFFGTLSGLGGVVGPFASDVANRAEGTTSLRLTVQTSGKGFAGWFTAWGDATRYADEGFTRDMSRFAGGSLRFAVNSPVNLEVGIRSGNVAAGSESSKVLLSQLWVAMGSGWKPVCLPMSLVTGPSPQADAKRIKILFVVAVSEGAGGTGGVPVTFWIDSVRWDTRPC